MAKPFGPGVSCGGTTRTEERRVIRMADETLDLPAANGKLVILSQTAFDAVAYECTHERPYDTRPNERPQLVLRHRVRALAGRHHRGYLWPSGG